MEHPVYVLIVRMILQSEHTHAAPQNRMITILYQH